MKTLNVLAVLALGLAVPAAAQQHDHAAEPGGQHGEHGQMGGGMERMHAMMARHDSLDRVLEAKLDRMNAARGTARVEAMAEVLTELVAQRKAQRAMMHEMMMGMMHGERHGAAGDAKPSGHEHDR